MIPMTTANTPSKMTLSKIKGQRHAAVAFEAVLVEGAMFETVKFEVALAEEKGEHDPEVLLVKTA